MEPESRLPASDAELITRVRGGDRTAFGELYERHHGPATGVARQYARAAAEADDLVAESFAKVLDALLAGRGPDTAFRAYLFTTIRHTAFDRTRKDSRLQFTDDIAAHETPEIPVDPVLAGAEASLVARAFQSLPERWQAVLWHTEVERESPQQVGVLLGLSANAVTSLAFRAREGLRQAYLQAHLADAAARGCRTTVERLGAWTRGSLSRRERSEVEAHLSDCERCRALAAELEEMNTSLRAVLAPVLLGGAALGYLASAPPAEAAAGVGAGAVSGASAMSGASGTAAASSPWWASGFAVAAAAAGVVVAVVAGIVIVTGGRDTTAPPPSMTPPATVAPATTSSPAPSSASPSTESAALIAPPTDEATTTPQPTTTDAAESSVAESPAAETPAAGTSTAEGAVIPATSPAATPTTSSATATSTKPPKKTKKPKPSKTSSATPTTPTSTAPSPASLTGPQLSASSISAPAGGSASVSFTVTNSGETDSDLETLTIAPPPWVDLAGTSMTTGAAFRSPAGALARAADPLLTCTGGTCTFLVPARSVMTVTLLFTIGAAASSGAITLTTSAGSASVALEVRSAVLSLILGGADTRFASGGVVDSAQLVGILADGVGEAPPVSFPRTAGGLTFTPVGGSCTSTRTTVTCQPGKPGSTYYGDLRVTIAEGTFGPQQITATAGSASVPILAADGGPITVTRPVVTIPES